MTRSTAAADRLWMLQQRLAPYLFLLPFAVLFAAFLLYPLLRSIILSLHSTTGPARTDFVGLRNYAFLLGDRLFWFALFNTLGFTLAFLLIQVPASLGLALLLNSRRLRGRGLLRFAFFSPYLVGPVFVAVLFSQVLSVRHGLIPRALRAVGLPWEFDVLNDPRLAMLGVLIAALWLSIGFGMIYLLAALQAVDRALYDAASIDGAGRWARFRHVTLPGIRPVLVLLIFVGTIASLQLFELPWILFGGPGPGGAGMTIVMYLFLVGWNAGDLGYASAIGWALVAVILIVSAGLVRAVGRRA